MGQPRPVATPPGHPRHRPRGGRTRLASAPTAGTRGTLDPRPQREAVYNVGVVEVWAAGSNRFDAPEPHAARPRPALAPPPRGGAGRAAPGWAGGAPRLRACASCASRWSASAVPWTQRSPRLRSGARLRQHHGFAQGTDGICQVDLFCSHAFTSSGAWHIGPQSIASSGAWASGGSMSRKMRTPFTLTSLTPISRDCRARRSKTSGNSRRVRFQ